MQPSATFNKESFFSRFPYLDLGDLKLRDIRLSDAEAYYSLVGDPRVHEFLADEDVPKSMDDAVKTVRIWGSMFYMRYGIFWAVTESNSDQMIGTVGLSGWNFNSARVELSYELLPAFWRRGIMTKVLNNVLFFAFQKMLVHRIEARTMLHNVRSQGMLNKLGFQQDGIERGYRFIRGKFEDIRLFSLLRNEFQIPSIPKPVEPH